MSLRLLTPSILLVFIFFVYSVTAQHVFDDSPDDRCFTPSRKPGTCIKLQDCPTLAPALNMELVKTDRHVKRYFERVLCHYRKQPIVCCERDAGACITPDNQHGSCVPLRRCDPMVNFLQTKPHFSDDKISYMKASECTYKKGDEFARICCPIFTSNITGQILSRFDQTTPKITELTTRKSTTPRPVTTPKITELSTPKKVTPGTTPKPIVAKVPLPKPGEDTDQCGAEMFQDRIINGNKSDIYSFPWMALLKMGNGEYACGGSLIHPRYVLTAAHCVTGPKVEAYKNLSMVRLGEWDVESEIDCVTRSEEGYEECTDRPIDFEPEEIIPHPEFSIERLQHDIALIRLKTEAPWTDFIRPICLPVEHIDLPEDQKFTVAGWGATESARSSNVKLFLDNLPLYDTTKCKEKYLRSKVTLGTGQICVGGLDAQDSCSGDSGGPLMLHRKIKGLGSLSYQIGIVSFGPSICGIFDRPAVYTRVESYMDWIYQNMRE